MTLTYTAEIYEEDGGYASVCPELVVASCGDTIEEARAMLVEAIELTLEEITPEEYDFRVSGEMSATSDLSDEEVFEDSTLIESTEIEVNVDLPFVPAR
jgi:predicted RNase H-like HicB family nuclease